MLPRSATRSAPATSSACSRPAPAVRRRADYSNNRYDYILDTLLRLKQAASTLSPADLERSFYEAGLRSGRDFLPPDLAKAAAEAVTEQATPAVARTPRSGRLRLMAWRASPGSACASGWSSASNCSTAGAARVHPARDFPAAPGERLGRLRALLADALACQATKGSSRADIGQGAAQDRPQHVSAVRGRHPRRTCAGARPGVRLTSAFLPARPPGRRSACRHSRPRTPVPGRTTLRIAGTEPVGRVEDQQVGPQQLVQLGLDVGGQALALDAPRAAPGRRTR